MDDWSTFKREATPHLCHFSIVKYNFLICTFLNCIFYVIARVVSHQSQQDMYGLDNILH